MLLPLTCILACLIAIFHACLLTYFPISRLSTSYTVKNFLRKISYRNELHRKSILYKRSDSSDRSLIYKSSTSFLGVWSFLDKRCVWRDRSHIEDRFPVQLISIRDFPRKFFTVEIHLFSIKDSFVAETYLNETFLNNFLTVEVNLKRNQCPHFNFQTNRCRIRTKSGPKF